MKAVTVPQTVHVEPVNDLIAHITDGEDCPCGPAVEPVPDGDGAMGWLVIHHSLDGREQREPHRQRPGGNQ
ncbi:hypothetical protein [Micromonospora sp. CA-248212]|uniref:hypothetical protein n=1 Tax=Micromonospora sp. CA-248212 TaxID=3239961 RepID=UPI003D8EFFD0